MRAAVLREYGATPAVEDFDEPSAVDGQVVVDVVAAGINPVDLAMASGQFYGGKPPLPSVVGREGVGRLGDGRLAYFDAPVPPSGSLADRAAVGQDSLVPLPDGLDPALATCFGIAGLAAWLALEWRAQLSDGETVLVLGASGPVGQVAVQAARLLGAGWVVAAARSADRLARAEELGADTTVQIGEAGDLAQAFRDASQGGADVVIDPLWGEPAAAAIQAANPGARLVQLGQSAGAEATIPSAAVRGKLLNILGHTNFGAPGDVKRAAYEKMAGHGARGELTCDLDRVPLAAAGEAWERQRSSPHRKLVVVPAG